jgi:hypothetical protein
MQNTVLGATAFLEGANGGRIFYFYTLLGFPSKILKWLKALYFQDIHAFLEKFKSVLKTIFLFPSVPQATQ